MMTNQLVNGTTQVQTMPMVTQSTEQPQQQTHQQQDITTSQIVVSTPDRNQQTDLNMQTISAPMSAEEALKTSPKRIDTSITEEAPTPMDTLGNLIGILILEK